MIIAIESINISWIIFFTLVSRNYILVQDYVFVFLRIIMYDVFHRSPCHANNELNSLFSSFTS